MKYAAALKWRIRAETDELPEQGQPVLTIIYSPFFSPCYEVLSLQMDNSNPACITADGLVPIWRNWDNTYRDNRIVAWAPLLPLPAEWATELPDIVTSEQQVTNIIEYLYKLVQPKKMKYRMEEIRSAVAQLKDMWEAYLRDEIESVPGDMLDDRGTSF